MDTIERIVTQHSFFAGMDQALLHLVVGCASNMRFDAESYIFKEGDEANAFYLIREGKVALEIFAPQRKPIVLDMLEVGDVLGWSWLLPPFHWKFNAHAKTNLHVIALDGRCLRTKCEENHDLGYELLKRFALIIERRLEATRFQLLDVYGGRKRA
ncbi:MAG: cyclic nucleotide-binding domain-containing protein [Acidobacteriia bacterium]|nr:cyclic nucleotide-binding domain-containing protein [Terriglobia bacterium]